MFNPPAEPYNLTYIPAPNISSGFHSLEIDLLRGCNILDTVLLVMEPPLVIPVLQPYLPNSKLSVLTYDGALGQQHEVDLNIPTLLPGEPYDGVLSQATLEHVCDPVQAMKNFANWTDIGGHIVVHTVGPLCPEHRIPVDCVRFLPDWYHQITNYIPIELVYFKEVGCHQFVCYERKA